MGPHTMAGRSSTIPPTVQGHYLRGHRKNHRRTGNPDRQRTNRCGNSCPRTRSQFPDRIPDSACASSSARSMAYFPRDIRILSARRVPLGFPCPERCACPRFIDTRCTWARSCRRTCYGSTFTTRIPSNIAKMEAAARLFPANTISPALQKRAIQAQTTVRRIFRCELKKKGPSSAFNR